MTYWKLISTGDPVQTGDPVGPDRITTSPARAGTGEPLHRLEPVPVRPESDRYHALLAALLVIIRSVLVSTAHFAEAQSDTSRVVKMIGSQK